MLNSLQLLVTLYLIQLFTNLLAREPENSNMTAGYTANLKYLPFLW